MKKTTPHRFIRWIVALMGGDPNQIPIPPLRRPLDITVQRQGDTHVAIIKPQGNGTQPGGVAYTNVVYLIGEVADAVAGKAEIELVTAGSTKSVRVCAVPQLRELLGALQEGDLVVLIGEVDGPCVRATRLYRLNRERRKRLYE
jgi:hypothetical protein